MKKKLMLLIFILILPFSSTAQDSLRSAKTDDRGKSPLAVIDKLWEAMRAKNFEAISSLFTPEGQLVAVDKPRDGKGISKTRVFTAEAFAKMIAEAKAPEFIEKMPQPKVEMFGDLATVSGRYTFHVGDKFSHCGTNTFNLVKTETDWRIANAATTLEFQCDRDLKTIKIPTIEADPKDVSTIDGIVTAFYEVVSGGKGVERQWGREKTLYMPEARMTATSIGKDGKPRAQMLDIPKYINLVNDFFVKEGFVEREIGRVTRQFGNIAHVFSAYEFMTTDKKITGRGINSLQLFWDGSRWWISAVTWDEERPSNPIPKEFLTKDKSK